MSPRLRALYYEWRVYQPDYGSCCSKEHYIRFNNHIVPVDDDLVCERELAWRKYVRCRDKNPAFGTALSVVKYA